MTNGLRHHGHEKSDIDACQQQRYRPACASAQSVQHLCYSLSKSTKVILAACNVLTRNAPIATKVVCFSRLLKCLKSLYDNQCGPRSDCCSGSTLFASILNSSVMLGNYLQQTISADDIFRCIFSWRFKG